MSYGYLKEHIGRAYDIVRPPTGIPIEDDAESDMDDDQDELEQRRRVSSLPPVAAGTDTATVTAVTAGYSISLNAPVTAAQSSSLSASSSRSPLQLSGSGSWTRDWNREFQGLLDEDDTEAKYTRLFHLAHDFVFAAATYSKIIISELCVPAQHKTVPPVPVGGVAGGEKFCIQNILFKRLADVQVNGSTWMYGGKEKNDAYAMKSGSHEMKGVTSWYSCHIAKLHFPLMAVIDYKGFRMLAISVVPVDKTTLAHGSSDGGITVHDDNEELASKIEEAASILNLKQHVVGHGDTKMVRTGAPGDLEGHVGHDGRFYLLDFSRTMPPEYPWNEDDPRSVYRKVFRPEFVRRWRKRLCNDALTNWQRNDPDAAVHNAEIEEASSAMVTEVIPAFAAKLDASVSAVDEAAARKQYLVHRAMFAAEFARIHGMSSKVEPSEPECSRPHRAASSSGTALTQKGLITEMHRCGINVRFLGLVHKLARSSTVRSVVLLEMAARVIKNIIRERFRAKMFEVRTLSEEPFKEVALEVISQAVGARRSLQFWHRVQVMIADYFWGSEQLNLIMEEIDQKDLCLRVQELADVRLSDAANRSLLENPSSFEFVDSDISELIPRIRHMSIIDFSEGMSLLLTAQRKTGSDRMRILKLAEARLESSIASAPDNFLALFYCAKTLFLEASEVDSTSAELILKDATTRVQMSIALKGDFEQAHMLLAELNVLQACRDKDAATVKAKFAESLASFRAAASAKPSVAFQLQERLAAIFTRVSKSASLHVLEGFALLFRGTHDAMRGLTEDAIGSKERLSACGGAMFLSGDATLRSTRFAKTAAREHELLLAACKRFTESLAYDRTLQSGIVARADEMSSSADTMRIRAPFLGASMLYSVALTTSPDDKRLLLANINALLTHASRSGGGLPYITEAGKCLETMARIDRGAVDTKVARGLRTGGDELCDLVRMASRNEVISGIIKSSWGTCSVAKVSLTSCVDFGDEELAGLGGIATGITWLDLSHCISLTDAALETLFASFSSLEHLSLDGCTRISFACWESDKSPPSLTDLSLVDCAIGDAAIEGLARASKKLVSLNLTRCQKLTSLALCSPNGGLATLSGLTSLSLNSCLKIDATGLMALASRCTGLRCLDVGSCGKVDDTVLSLIGLRLLRLEALDVSFCTRITDEGMTSMLQAMCISHSDENLTKLSVKGCRHLSEGSLEGISKLRSLKKLNIGRLPKLSGNLAPLSGLVNLRSLKSSAVALLSKESLGSILSGVRNLVDLDLSGCSTITDSVLEDTLSRLPPMRSLRLRQCSSLSEVFVPSFARHSASMVKLDLSATPISDSSVREIAVSFRSLEVLCLSGCTKLVTSVSDIATNLTGLRVLDLGWCSRVTDSSVALVAEHLPLLERLTLDYCSQVSTKTVLLVVQRLTNLTHLSLRDCSGMSDAAVEQMACCLRKLRVINLVGCVALSQEPLANLRRRAVLLEKAALSLDNKGIVAEIQTGGFGSHLQKIPDGELKWLRRSQEIRERSAHSRGGNVPVSSSPPLQRDPSPPSERGPTAPPKEYLPTTTKLPYAVLVRRPIDCDPSCLELYLTEEEMAEVLGPNFLLLPRWKRDAVKREKRLF